MIVQKKQDRSRKQNSSSKQDSLNKHDKSNEKVNSCNQYGSISLKHIDTDFLMKTFLDFSISKITCFEEAQAARDHGKEILAGLFRVRKKLLRNLIIFIKSV